MSESYKFEDITTEATMNFAGQEKDAALLSKIGAGLTASLKARNIPAVSRSAEVSEGKMFSKKIPLLIFSHPQRKKTKIFTEFCFYAVGNTLTIGTISNSYREKNLLGKDVWKHRDNIKNRGELEIMQERDWEATFKRCFRETFPTKASRVKIV